MRKLLPPQLGPDNLFTLAAADGPGTITTPVADPPPPAVNPRVAEAAAPLAPDAAGKPQVDERRVPLPPPPPAPTSRKVPEVVTPIVGPEGQPARDERLTPTVASSTPAPNSDDEYKKKLQAMLGNKDFMGALAGLAGSIGGKAKTPVPPVFHVGAPQRMPQGKDLTGAGGAMMAKAMEELAKFDLTVPIKRKPGEQARYDILRGK